MAHAYKKALPILLLCGAGATPSSGLTETYTIEVLDFEFSPNSLTIKPGDTVRWWAWDNEERHSIVADDLSWEYDSGPLRFEYFRQYDSPGEYRYHCGYHSSPGRDIDGFENGVIIVEDEANGSAFTINSGVTDAWYNPETAGQGFFIIVWEESRTIFLSWFTFDTVRPPADVAALLGEPGHRWMTAQGSYEGDTANLTVYLTQGGVFDSDQPPASTDLEGYGSMTIEFSGCEAGLLSYQIPSLALVGEIPIERVTLDNVALCEALATP